MRTAIFDFGGVFGNQDIINPEILNELVAVLGTDEHTFWDTAASAYAEALKGNATLYDVIATADRKKAGMAEELVLALYRKKFVIDKELISYAQSLRNTGIRVICASNVIREYLTINQAAGGYTAFDACYFSCDLGVNKPDKQFFKTILDAEQVSPNECVFVDDNVRNVDIAQLLGMHAMLFSGNIEEVKIFISDTFRTPEKQHDKERP